MSAGVAQVRRDAVEASVAKAAVEIDLRSRWDALALSELLIPFHSFLVQHGRERSVAHARSSDCHGDPLDDALAAVDHWRGEQAIEAAVRIGGQPDGRQR